uniref:Agouti domain-containing protein n=1 Tax=Periophthalmus magnuspinnatus TaxID=409849 RepID=A0A3B4A2M8_9GOBI
MIRRVAGKHLLCLLLLAFPLAWAVYTKKDARTTQKNDTGQLHTALLTLPRRCSRLMESCSSWTLCCDPCASCHCRLFNTICHCWRTNPLCLKRT